MLFNQGFPNRFLSMQDCRQYNVSTGCFCKLFFVSAIPLNIVKKLNNDNFRVCVLVQSRIHTIVIIAPQFHSNDKLIMVTVCVTCETHYDENLRNVGKPFRSRRGKNSQKCSKCQKGFKRDAPFMTSIKAFEELSI